MGLDHKWEEKILNHPEWEKIRAETIDSGIFSKLCWYINNGIGYCEEAPENLKVYMRRLDIKV